MAILFGNLPETGCWKSQPEKFSLPTFNRDHRAVSIKPDFRAGFGGLAGAHLGQHFNVTDKSLKQDLYLPASGFSAEESRRDDSSIIKDHQILRLDQTNQVAELIMCDLAGCGVEMHQSTVAAIRSGILRDQMRRQLKIEFTDFQQIGNRLKKEALLYPSSGCDVIRRWGCSEIQLEHAGPVDKIRAVFIDQQAHVVLAFILAPAHFTFQAVKY